MRILLAFALIQVVGFLVLKVVAGSRSSLTTLEHWCLSFGTGSGVLGMLMFYLASLGNPLNPPTVLIMTTLLLMALMTLLAVRRRRRNGRESENPSSDRSELNPSVSRLSAVEWASLAVIGLCAFIVFADAFSQPLLAFDARAIWAFKAKVLYSEQGIYNEAFLDPERLHAKTRYPQLIPLTETFVASIVGRFDERILKLIFPCFYVSLTLLLGCELRRGLDRRYTMVATALFASLPVFTIYANGGAASGYADVPLSFYVTALTSSLFRWLQTRPTQRLQLAALFTTLTVFTKTEGLALVFVVFLAVAGAAWTYERSTRSLWVLLLAASLGLLCLVPWFIYQTHLPVVDENFYELLTPARMINGIHRWRYIAWSLGKEFFMKPHLWNLLGVSAALLFLRAPRKVVHSWFCIFFWIPVLYVMVLCLIFVVIPWQLEDLLPVALTRLVMQVAPLLFLWVCLETAGLLPGTPDPSTQFHRSTRLGSN